ncbi:MAG: ACP S-malonyltransferase [Lachnospiraceae bacterium]|nr:ACP S-malonyltransferase [Lachnospiraceae bacterium]
MSKIAVLFPGQGSQYPGMGKDFFEQYDIARQVYELAGTAAGLDVKTLCFTNNDLLDQTEYTQIAMLTTEVAMYKVAASLGLRADVCAGLSLGEYGALAAAEVMALTDCFQIIRKRGKIMQEAYPSGGGMVAVLGLSGEQVETAICGIAEVGVANFNCPGQVVISGRLTGLEEASKKLMEAGAKRCVPLKVSGPFHSPLLEKAGRKLSEELRGVNLEDPWIPYVTNVDATYVTDCARVKDLLSRQIYSSVRWQQSMERLIADGVDVFVEIGPGKTLKGFFRKIDPNVKCLSIETVEDMKKVLEEL